MNKFKTKSDKPFKYADGDTLETAIYNRIAAINRINFIVSQTVPNFDIRFKPEDFLKCLDLELFKTYYYNKPDYRIDEEFCQRAAKVCIEMLKE